MTRTVCLLAVVCFVTCFMTAVPVDAANPPSLEDKQVDQLSQTAIDTTLAIPLLQRTSAIDSIGRIGSRSSESGPKLTEILDAGLTKSVVTDDERPLYLLHAIGAAQRVGPPAIVTISNLTLAESTYPELSPYVNSALTAILPSKVVETAPSSVPTAPGHAGLPTASDLNNQLTTLVAAMGQSGNYVNVISATTDIMNNSPDPFLRTMAAQLARRAILSNPAPPLSQPYIDGLTKMLAPPTAGLSQADLKIKTDEQIFAARAFGDITWTLACIPRALLVASTSTDPEVKTAAQNAIAKLSK
jgi:hypothetical protein